MTSVAIVEKITDGKIIVSTMRKGACGDNCAMCGACNSEKLLTEVHSDISVEIGDTVRIESSTKYVLLALSCLFLLPVCIPILVYVLTGGLNSTISYGVTAIGFLLSICFVFFLSKSRWFVSKITPSVVDIIKKK